MVLKNLVRPRLGEPERLVHFGVLAETSIQRGHTPVIRTFDPDGLEYVGELHDKSLVPNGRLAVGTRAIRRNGLNLCSRIPDRLLLFGRQLTESVFR